MNDHRHAGASTGEAFDRDIARALAVDPSPEFVARVRTRIANEPAPAIWRRAGFATWRTAGFATRRRAFLARRSARRAKAAALRSPWLASAAVAAAVLIAAVVIRWDDAGDPAVAPALTARAIGALPASVPYVASALRRTEGPARAGRHVPPATGPAEAGRHVLPATIRTAAADPVPLLDPRETRALRALIAGVRDSGVDLSPLLRAAAPAPMELPPVEDLVIAPLAIEPLAPIDGAQGERP
jgi:hypothetical protein